MAAVDSLKPEYRALVHEYGLVIVAKCLNDCDYSSAEALREQLEGWRVGLQTEWLATDYVTEKLREGFGVTPIPPEMMKAKQKAALKVATPEKLKAMMLEEAARCGS